VRKNFRFVVWPALIIVVGTLGYRIIEGFTLLDSLYMTCITITTVGFREVESLSATGKLFTIALIFAGLSTVAVAASQIGQDMIAMTSQRHRLRMEKQIAKLTNHYIVCGFGRMGRVIAEHLRREGVDHVIVDHTPEIVGLVREEGGFALEGDSTSDETLEKAGVTRARGLVSVLAKDAENVFVVLTARQLNPDLVILARANNDDAIPKLYRAGASVVINPYESAGARIVQTLIRPVVTDFMQVASPGKGVEVVVEQIEVQNGSPLAGKSLRQSEIRRVANAMVVGIRKAESAQMKLNPDGDEVILPGDILVVIAHKGSLDALADLARTTGHV
jgi:voltage-gated potassium channel